jgi:L-iditol 2-dehydrogenase/threonine 3-dehydrogenase
MYYLGEHELNVYGSMMYLHEDYEAAVEMISRGKIVTAPILTANFPLAKYLDAYRFIESKGDTCMKVMIDV